MSELLGLFNEVAPLEPITDLVDILAWITNGKSREIKFKLFDDVSMVYELQLAKMEFSRWSENLDSFRCRTAYFEEVAGEKSWHFYLSSIVGKGQIGHSNQYLTHWFYPYKGKFHGQMIKALLNFMAVTEQSTVLDPFVGSGTTIVECATIGVLSVGVEINPALCFVSLVKHQALSIDFPKFRQVLHRLPLSKIFQRFTQQLEKPKPLELPSMPFDGESLSQAIWEQIFPDIVNDLPFEYRNLLLLVFLHALSDYTYLKDTGKARPLEVFWQENLTEYFRTIEGVHRVREMLSINFAPARIFCADALTLPLPGNSVEGIVTSPPYSIALDYVRNDEHLLKYFGLNADSLRRRMIGLKGQGKQRLVMYEQDMRQSLLEMVRVLKPYGWVAIILGDVVVGEQRTDFCQRILQWAPELGFDQAIALRRPILGGYARLRFEYILLLRKGGNEDGAKC
ncbi:MAG: DNA methyltransferase [Armatimonadetes bacterium]|nr:DNA methyltransferase [Armatimonadota bacterium]MDW8028922.1 DNA methyltransferase [Armatimonadota bacterium]